MQITFSLKIVFKLAKSFVMSVVDAVTPHNAVRHKVKESLNCSKESNGGNESESVQ